MVRGKIIGTKNREMHRPELRTSNRLLFFFKNEYTQSTVSYPVIFISSGIESGHFDYSEVDILQKRAVEKYRVLNKWRCVVGGD